MTRTLQLIFLCIVLMHSIDHSNGKNHLNHVSRARHIKHLTGNGTQSQCSDSNKDYARSSTYWIGGTWVIAFAIAGYAIYDAYINTPEVETVFDGCQPGYGVYSYLIKLRTQILPGQFYAAYEKKAIIALDINDRKDNFVTRLRVPILPERKKSDGEVRQSIKFKVVREEPLPTMRTIRIDHNCHTENILVYYIELRDLGNIHNVYKAPINTVIKELTPYSPFRAELFEFKSSQGQIDADTDAPDPKKKDPKEEFDSEVPANLSLVEYVLFVFLAVNLLYLGSIFFPVHICDFTTDTTIWLNSLVDAVITLLVLMVVMVFYKWVKSSQSSEVSWLRISVVVISVCASFGAGGYAMFQALEFGEDQLTYWRNASLVAMAIFVVVFSPICISVRIFCIPKRTPTVREDTVSAQPEEIKSDLGKALKDVVVVK